MALDDFEQGRYPEPDTSPDGDPDFWQVQRAAIFGHLTAVTQTYGKVRSVGLEVRSPDLRAAIEEAGDLVELIGNQLHTWSIQAAKGDKLQPELASIRLLDLNMSHGIGVLPALAERAEHVVRQAAGKSNTVDLWSLEAKSDATMTP